MKATEPNPEWDTEAHGEAVETFEAARGEVSFRVWGADWCGDCRAELPDLFAALDAAGVAPDAIEVHEVDENKEGERTDEYDVTHIPTVVVERRSPSAETRSSEDEVIARFEESEPVPAADYLAERLLESDALA